MNTFAASFQLVLLPVGLGLLGFIEPCTMGSNLLLVKYLERRPPKKRRAQLTLYILTRSLLMGMLGMLAALIGRHFLGLQHAFWIGLGALYSTLGLIYLADKSRWLMLAWGPSLDCFSGSTGSMSLGLLFGLNIPACAAPLILVLLGASATGSASGGSLLQGFWLLALFGLALSLPLVMLEASVKAQRWLDRLAALSVRLPRWTGAVLLALGAWSIAFGLAPH